MRRKENLLRKNISISMDYEKHIRKKSYGSGNVHYAISGDFGWLPPGRTEQ